MSSAAVGITPRAEVASSAPVSASVTTRPSASVNNDRWDRSQRANALSIALARSANVWAGPTAKTRPGYGHNGSPLPPRSSTLTDIHRRAMRSTLTYRALTDLFPRAHHGRMSRVPWNFGGGPMIIRLRSRFHHDGRHRQSARRHAVRGRLAVLVGAGGR